MPIMDKLFNKGTYTIHKDSFGIPHSILRVKLDDHEIG